MKTPRIHQRGAGAAEHMMLAASIVCVISSCTITGCNTSQSRNSEAAHSCLQGDKKRVSVCPLV